MCALTAEELGSAYRRRELSPVEVARAHLRRIAQLDDLGTYITVDAAGAVESAEQSERRFERSAPASALDGIPIGIKDNIDVAGLPTTGGSPSQGRSRAPIDSPVVGRLRSAGATILGKHSLFELAAGGGPRYEGGFPVALNPWLRSHATGGSSSGSAAAVAAGAATLALGSDSGGSVRFPAALCGVVGFKPSSGSLPVTGIRILSWSLDQIGIFARNAADVSATFRVMSARGDEEEPEMSTQDPLPGLRIGVPEGLLTRVPEMDSDVMSSFRSAMQTLAARGARIVAIDIPLAAEATVIGSLILRAEAFAAHRSLARRDPKSFGRRFYLLLLQGSLISSADYVRALQARAQLIASVSDAMEGIDVIAVPTAPTPAWPTALDAGKVHAPSTPNRHLFTYIFNVTGQPAISAPWATSRAGLPIGIQLAARHGGDGFLLRVAHAAEGLRPWPRLAPGVPLS